MMKIRKKIIFTMVFIFLFTLTSNVFGEPVKSSEDKTAKIKLALPKGFSWTTAPINIYKNSLGEITTDFDATKFQWIGKGKTYYVNKATGSNTNNGLTRSTAFKQIAFARSRPDVDTIIVASGTYEFSDAFNGSIKDSKSISIKAEKAAEVIITNSNTLKWAKTSGYTNVYQASRSNIADNGVYDAGVLNSAGDYTKLKKVSSLAEVEAVPGSYYYDLSTIYAHTVNSRPADSKIRCFFKGYNFYNVGNYTTYLEGLKFYGGENAVAWVQVAKGTDNPLFVAKNCEFKYSTNGQGIAMRGVDVILQNSITSSNNQDGFNYHANSGRIPKVIEVNSKSYYNGIGRNNWSDNASTIHDGGKIIRVNGKYHTNEGPNIADVGIGTESWNVGDLSYNSICNTLSNRTNYYISEGKMWIESSSGYGSLHAYVVGPTGSMLIKDSMFDDGVPILDSTGSKAYY